MQVATVVWRPDAGWSAPLPDLDSETTLVVVLGDHSLRENAEVLSDLAAAFPRSVLIGCSTAGQITATSVFDHGCAVSIVRFDHARIVRAATDIDVHTARAAGSELAVALAGPDLRAIFVLSDGLNVNGTDLVKGVTEGAGPAVVVTGGLAGDGDRFADTWVIDDGELRGRRVVAVGLYGDRLEVGTGSYGGWGIFGPERLVTRSQGNVLYELDGGPALDLYHRYLGDLAADLPASALLFPLAIRSGPGEEQLVRTVLGVNAVEKSMTFAGDIPQGWRAQLMRSSADRLVDGAAAAAAQTGGSASAATVAIAISCVGRRLALGERTDEEIDAMRGALPPDCAVVGFYSYGEIAPGASGACDLHNQTMTITTLAEV